MSEMVDRVAKALARKSGLIWDRLDEDATSVEESRDHWRDHARAAIEAMRQPTGAMLEAGPGEPYMDADVWARRRYYTSRTHDSQERGK